MEAPFQIVGCVLSSRPDGELIDDCVAQLRRARAVVMTKSAQGATFVRFSAADTSLVTLACQAAGRREPASLRFGFALGARDPTSVEADGVDVSTRSIVQASDLASGAADGEVLVSPQLAVLLIESGVALRSLQVRLAGGRVLQACMLEPAPEAGARPTEPLARPTGATRSSNGAGAPSHRPATAASETSLLLQASQGRDLPSSTSVHQAEGLDGVFRALMAQAEQMAARQAEVEARQDALLARMTLVDEGSRPSRHLASLEAELDAQMERVQGRLEFIESLEQRVHQLRTVTADVERRLTEQLARRAEVESLKHLCDLLVGQMAEAHEKLDRVTEAQARLSPMEEQVASIAQAIEQSRQAIGAVDGQLADLGGRAADVVGQMASLAEREALVRAVRAEVEQIHSISERAKIDLQFVAEHRQDVQELRAKVDQLLAGMAATDDKLAAVDAHRKLLDEVQARADSFTHLLGDMHVNLEMLGEQRAVIEHVGEKLARLDFTVREAQNTLRALQREREVAERVEQGIKSLRARTAAGKPV